MTPSSLFAALTPLNELMLKLLNNQISIVDINITVPAFNSKALYLSPIHV